ncbi:MAG TPA: alpha/beta fold hydrolase [Opitutaceae bacterium]
MSRPTLPVLLATLFIACAPQPGPLRAQNLVPADWVLVRGDDAGFLAAESGTPEGQPIDLCLGWERQGFPGGESACLGAEFTAPETLRATGLRYEFALLARQAELFVNGRLVATAPAGGKTASGRLPDDLLRWGGKNRISARVLGHPWTGGDVRDFIRILPADDSFPRLDVEVLHPNPAHEYPDSRDIVLPIRLETTAGAEMAGDLRWWVESDFHQRVRDGRSTFRAGTAGAAPLTLALGKLAPGFYCVCLRFSWDHREVAKDFWIAVAPTKIASAPSLPPDFDDYWQRARKELAAVPPAFAVTPEPGLSTAKQAVFTVSMRSLGGVELKGWYIVPARGGRFPAVLHLPGYGATMRPQRFLDGSEDVIRFALDIRGHGRSTAAINPGFGMPGYVGYQIHDPEQYVYRGAYMDCGRALEFLASREEVDAGRIAVNGFSQGGGLAFAAAALFPEYVSACAAGVPFLGVPQEHFRIRTIYREEMERHLALAKQGTWDDTLRSLGLVDTANLASRIRCPVFMAVALHDDDCPPHIGFAVYNRLTAPKSYQIFPDVGHGMGGRWPATSMAWIRSQLGLARAAVPPPDGGTR